MYPIDRVSASMEKAEENEWLLMAAGCLWLWK
jgi:hypothetical protein